jgi:hypothetical protein
MLYIWIITILISIIIVYKPISNILDIRNKQELKITDITSIIILIITLLAPFINIFITTIILLEYLQNSNYTFKNPFYKGE